MASAAFVDGRIVAVGGRTLSADRNLAALERYDPATESWTTLPDMPTERGGLGAAFVDGRIVAVGGEEPNDVLGTVEAFDVRSGTWSAFPGLSTPRHGLAVAAVGNTVYAIGGATRPTHVESTAVAEALDMPPRILQPAAAWRTLPDARTERQQVATTVADGTIWVLGGLDNDSGSTPKVEGYDAAIDNWKSGPDLPVALNHAMAVTYRNEIVALGGWIPAGSKLNAKDSARVLALRKGTWTDLPPLPQPRVAGTAVVVGDKIVVTGGQHDGKLVTTTDVFDGTGWTTVAGLPTPREHLAAVTDGTFVYTVGGRDLSSDKNSAALERFDPATASWEKLPDLPTKRGGLGATFLNGRIVTVGGETPNKALPTVEAFDVESGTWQKLADLRTPRHGLAVAAVANTVYAIGGAKVASHAQSTAASEALDFG